MKALQITGYGVVEGNVAFRDVDIRKINDEEVLIEVFAASTNPIDYKIVEGALKQVFKLDFPTGIGYDVAGKIKNIGKNVKNFKNGDEVFSSVSQKNPPRNFCRICFRT